MCFLCLFVAKSIFGAHVREEDHVADRGFVGEEHHEAIDADADACGGQQVPATVYSSSAYVLRGGKWLAASHQETTAK
jgi:hypothetical protein